MGNNLFFCLSASLMLALPAAAQPKLNKNNID